MASKTRSKNRGVEVRPRNANRKKPDANAGVEEDNPNIGGGVDDKARFLPPERAEWLQRRLAEPAQKPTPEARKALAIYKTSVLSK